MVIERDITFCFYLFLFCLIILRLEIFWFFFLPILTHLYSANQRLKKRNFKYCKAIIRWDKVFRKN